MNFKDGKLDGLVTKWDGFGNKVSEERYKKGKLIDPDLKWYEKGNLVSNIR